MQNEFHSYIIEYRILTLGLGAELVAQVPQCVADIARRSFDSAPGFRYASFCGKITRWNRRRL